MNQLQLFSNPPTDAQLAKPLARRTDPIGSAIAAQNHIASGRHESQKMRVLRAIVANPASTFRELAAICGLEPHAVERRANDLRKAGLISSHSDAKRTCRVSGERGVQVFVGTGRGEDLLANNRGVTAIAKDRG